MKTEIFYSTSGEYNEREEVYIHLPVYDVMIRVMIPLGHDIEDLGLAYSYGEGWEDIKHEERKEIEIINNK